MAKTKTLVIIFAAGIILLISGFGSSYYWLTRIYLPEKIDANENARLLLQWTQSDPFTIPSDSIITKDQIRRYVEINQSLVYLFRRLRQKFEENRWAVAIEAIKMQPEWDGQKYVALKKFGMTPLEYKWISEQVLEFWVFRWKQESIVKLKEMGWKLDKPISGNTLIPENLNLLSNYEDELNIVLGILLPLDLKSEISDSAQIKDQ